MSKMLELYARGGFEFVDDDTGFAASDFGVSDNSINERVKDKSLPAYEQEVEFARESIENGMYDSAAKLAYAVAEVPHVEKVSYVGDLSIGYYEMYITTTSPHGTTTKSRTAVGFCIKIIVEVKDRNGDNAIGIAHEVSKIFENDLSNRLHTDVSNITTETRYI